MAAPPERVRKPESSLGLSLRRPIVQTLAATAPAALTLPAADGGAPLALADQPASSPSAAESLQQSLEIADRLAKRYDSHVQRVEKRRVDRLVPLDRQVPLLHDELTVARNVKKELDNVLSKASVVASSEPGKAQSWDSHLGKAAFQKKMQFLCNHAKTGHFIEQYGLDGRYEGEFMYGMRHGKGTHEFRGEVYEGDWKWDHRDGWGTLTLADASQIKGEWHKGKPDGFTSIIDPKGTIVYEGEFKDGKRHGLGRQLFESGDMYDGGWRQGRLHDRGVYYFTNGDKLYGMWSDGLYDGIGVFHYADGSISRRVYKEGLLMSVQDYEHTSQRFGKALTREGMQRSTRDKEFPKEVFLLSAV